MKKTVFLFLTLVLLISTLTLSVFASEEREDAITDTASEGEKINTGKSDNVFSDIYSIVSDNSDKIFSILAFTASVVVAFAYRKGLIPILKSALSTITSRTEKLGEFSAESQMKTEESLKFLSEKFVSCQNGVEGIARSLDELIERLDTIEGEKKESEKLKTIMLSQVDMLYDIFMQSSLPQYSKDAVGEKVTAMKKEIAGEG